MVCLSMDTSILILPFTFGGLYYTFVVCNNCCAGESRCRLRKSKKSSPTPITSLEDKDKRANIPTEELRDFIAEDEKSPRPCSTRVTRHWTRSWSGRARMSRIRPT